MYPCGDAAWAYAGVHQQDVEPLDEQAGEERNFVRV